MNVTGPWSLSNAIAITASSPTLDTNTWIFLGLLLALILFLFLAYREDHIAYVWGAALVLLLTTFQLWAVTSNVWMTLALGLVSLALFAVPTVSFMESQKEVR